MSETPASDDIQFPLTHTFSKPVEVLGDTVTSLTLRDPTANELLNFGVIDGTIDGKQFLELIAAMANKPLPFIKACPGIEIYRLTARLSRFFKAAGL